MAVKQKLPIYQRTQLTGGDFGTGDVYWDNVSLLALFGEERKDWSTVNHTLEFKGNAAFDTTISRFPGSRFGPNNSVVFDGTGDYVRVPDHISLSPESQSFTIECHIRWAVDPGTGIAQLVSKWDNPASWPPADGVNQEWILSFNNNQLRFIATADGTTNRNFADVAWNPSANVWYHVAAVLDRELATHETRIYIDGTQIGTSNTLANSYPTVFQGSSDVWISGYGGGTNDWINGNMENVRITKGVARYSENFTPPKAPYPNYKKRGPSTTIYLGKAAAPVTPDTIVYDQFYKDVVILAPYSTDFSDLSVNSNTGTAFGSPPAEISSTLTLFDQNTLRFPSFFQAAAASEVQHPDIEGYNLADRDFTVEFHFNWGSTGSPLNNRAAFIGQAGVTERSWLFAHDGTVGTPVFYYYYTTNGSSYLGQYGDWPFTPNQNQWYHIVFMRDGTSMRCFVDGEELTAGASTPIGTLYNSSRPLFVGDYGDSSFGESGHPGSHMANLRITRGIRRYVGNFTPPTAPYPTSASSGSPAFVVGSPELGYWVDPTNREASFPGTGITLYDISGNGLDFDYDTGNPAYVPDGGGSFAFANGAPSADTFDQPDDALTEPGETWSICWWSKHQAGSSSTQQYMISKLSNRLAIIAGYQPGNVNAFCNAGYQPSAASTQMPFTEEEWTFFCYTKGPNADSNNWKGYINGVEQFSLTQSFTISAGTTNHLGSTGTGTAQYQGKLGHVIYYNRELTAAEVLQNFNATRGSYFLPGSPHIERTYYDSLSESDTGQSITIGKDTTGSPPVDASGIFDYRVTGFAGTSGFSRATRGRSSGKYYFELSWENAGSGTGTVGCGLAVETLSNTSSTYSATGNQFWGVWGRNAGARHNNANTIAFTTEANERFGFACDFDDGKMWIWREGGSPQWIQGNPDANPGGSPQGVDPVWTDLTGTLYPVVQPWFAPVQITFHATPESLVNTVPTGYTAGWPTN